MAAHNTMASEASNVDTPSHQAATTLADPIYAAADAADKVFIQRAVIKSIQHVQHLGNGSFSTVDLVTVPVAANRKLCARKTLVIAATMQSADAPASAILPAACAADSAGSEQQPVKATTLQDFTREVAIHRACVGCPFLLQLLAAKRGQNSALLLLEYAANGSLFDLLQVMQEQQKKHVTSVLLKDCEPLMTHQGSSNSTIGHSASARMPETHVRFYMACVLEALRWLHPKGIIHRDIKPENLLLFSNGYVKLADMGCGCELPGGGMQLPCTQTGTKSYQAPEVKNKQPYSFAVDIWSLGVTAWHLLAGELPAWAHGTADASPLVFPAHFTLDVQQLLASMLTQNPGVRASVASIQDSPWFAGFSWEALQAQTMPAPMLGTIPDTA